MFKATKVFKAEIAHVLDSSYMKCCQNVHGHSIEVHVCVSSEKLNADGMVMDFKRLKEIGVAVIDPFDHRITISAATVEALDNVHGYETVHAFYPGLYIVPFNPTAENFAEFIFKGIQPYIRDGVRLESVTYYETQNAWIEYTGEG